MRLSKIRYVQHQRQWLSSDIGKWLPQSACKTLHSVTEILEKHKLMFVPIRLPQGGQSGWIISPAASQGCPKNVRFNCGILHLKALTSLQNCQFICWSFPFSYYFWHIKPCSPPQFHSPTRWFHHSMGYLRTRCHPSQCIRSSRSSLDRHERRWWQQKNHISDKKRDLLVKFLYRDHSNRIRSFGESLQRGIQIIPLHESPSPRKKSE